MSARLEALVAKLEDERLLGFAEFGDPEGPPVFVLHGTPGSRNQFRPGDMAAFEAGVRVIAPDRPGYGVSTPHPRRRLLDGARDVAALAELLELERFGVVGVSGGGPYALACAHALGDRLTGVASVSGLAPVDRPERLDGMMALNRAMFRLARRTPWLLGALLSLMYRGMNPDSALKRMQGILPEPDRAILARPDVREAFVAELRGFRGAGFAVAADFAIFARPWGFRLEDIDVPVEVWHGDRDRNVPVSHGRELADRIPNAKLRLCPGEGHLLVMDRSAEILRTAAGVAG